MTNNILQKALLRAQAKKKANKNGFTLIELMVVVAIVGILTAVGLPELSKAQNKAKSAAAKSFVVNEGKSCSLALVTNDSYTLSETPTNVDPVDGNSCAENGTIAATGGNVTWTVTLEDGVPGIPAESAAD